MIGFVNSLVDTSFFILKQDTDFVYMLIYVDDIIVMVTNSTLLEVAIDSLSARFSLKDHCNFRTFLE